MPVMMMTRAKTKILIITSIHCTVMMANEKGKHGPTAKEGRASNWCHQMVVKTYFVDILWETRQKKTDHGIVQTWTDSTVEHHRCQRMSRESYIHGSYVII